MATVPFPRKLAFTPHVPPTAPSWTAPPSLPGRVESASASGGRRSPQSALPPLEECVDIAFDRLMVNVRAGDQRAIEFLLRYSESSRNRWRPAPIEATVEQNLHGDVSIRISPNERLRRLNHLLRTGKKRTEEAEASANPKASD